MKRFRMQWIAPALFLLMPLSGIAIGDTVQKSCTTKNHRCGKNYKPCCLNLNCKPTPGGAESTCQE